MIWSTQLENQVAEFNAEQRWISVGNKVYKLFVFFFAETRIETFLESCGVADLVTTCYSGRNSKIAAVFAVTEGKVSLVFVVYQKLKAVVMH